ncbi:ABC transporter ATP-binding protein [Aerococcus kribbianus]|uniref:ATP-binding cassette domain-containing protein n=1 Tax=Aerococcus kribbianus TaxID=2999064 RepID=A0A9X3FM49_9LACT|nr:MULTISPECIES: ATP-binding cassette domain-containing protein [unclassified Aerococcus]MCZ0716905.1 ATP-binding cassette domain-containing protein [Aerococcus sp. YH-aer221]MCZ0725193.1 ATP-binding cassette domain-containing protein [Aerococcus sp. YH-aer222]
MTSKLQLKAVSKGFKRHTPDAFTALDQINLDIADGDFITLVGGNGAGKSTLLNSIAGHFPIDSGDIYLDGESISHLDEEERAAFVGRVFQNPAMGTAPRMTVAENLALAKRRGHKRRLRRSVKEDDRQEFAEMLSRLNLGLEDRLDTEIGSLSGGQRQTISLLMATINRPEILLLDEHTAALDPKTSKLILELTNQIVRNDKLSTLMITHNLQDAIDYGNRILVLSHGSILYDIKQEDKANLTAIQLYQLMEGV